MISYLVTIASVAIVLEEALLHALGKPLQRSVPVDKLGLLGPGHDDE